MTDSSPAPFPGDPRDTGVGTGTGTDTAERRWHYRRSLASRVTLLTTLAVGLSVAVLSVGVYVTARAQLQAQLDDDLRTRAAKIAKYDNTLDVIRAPTPYTIGASDVRIALAVIEDDRAYGLAKDGTNNTEIVGGPEVGVARREHDESMRTVRLSDGQRYRVIAMPAAADGQAIVLARSLANQDAVLSRLGVVSLVFGLLGVLGAGAAGWGVARNGLRPVRRLTTSVETIARTERLDPLPVEGDDEVARLAAAFNEMLAALSASRDRQRQLVTDAGHELRTPLTSLRTNVDLLVQSDHDQVAIDPTARAELLDDIRAQTDELTTLIGDLTELARDEPLAPVVGEVDLAEIVDVSVARVRRRAPDKTFDLQTVSWELFGEAPALERAVTNLLDNAAKWGPPGSTVTIRLEEVAGTGRLTVDDQGPGIAEADREHVFDRFWRAEESRTMPGSGLGLSIVRQVAERHSGRVGVDTAPGGGARLVLELPGRPGA